MGGYVGEFEFQVCQTLSHDPHLGLLILFSRLSFFRQCSSVDRGISGRTANSNFVSTSSRRSRELKNLITCSVRLSITVFGWTTVAGS